MKKAILIVCILIFSFKSYAVDIRYLLDALKKQPITKINSLMVKQAEIGYKKSTDNFYPSISGSASWVHYNSPTNLRPATPTENSRIGATSGSYPFSRNIKQIGVEVKVPLLVFPLFEISKKALELKRSASKKEKLEFIRNEATVVVLNAELEYLDKLKEALISEIGRLKKQRDILKVAAKNGKVAPISVFKIESVINSLKIKIDDIETSKNRVLSAMYTLTGVELRKAANMELIQNPKGSDFLPIKPIRHQLEAKRYAVKAKEAELLPKIYLSGNIYRKFGRSYNTNDPVIRNYGSIGVFLSIPIFNKPLYSDIELAKSDYVKTKFELQQKLRELKSESKELKKDLAVVNRSIQLAFKDVEYKKRLLEYAEVAFKVGRMTEEDYLKYVSDLLTAKANLYKLKMKKWEVITKLAVIFGNDLKELVR